MSMPMSMSSPYNASGRTIFSYKNGNVMLAAIILLLIAILLVLLLHIYAKWFMARARRRRLRRSLSGPNRLHTFTFETNGSSDKGLDASVIATIPMFVCTKEDRGRDEECVICLSGYEDGDVGRRLSGSCGHEFHVECIDMWLSSHSDCPLCRAPVVVASLPSNGSLIEEDVIVDVPDDDDDDLVGDDVAGTSSMGASLKRMMSCSNKSERKVHPSESSSSGSNI